MPIAAPRPCTYLGCGKLLRDGSCRCEGHQAVERKHFDAERGTAHERGYTAAWQRARDGWLRLHPLCVKHEERGEVEAAKVVGRPDGSGHCLTAPLHSVVVVDLCALALAGWGALFHDPIQEQGRKPAFT